MQAMDHGETEGVSDCASNESGSNRRSDGWCERLIREL